MSLKKSVWSGAMRRECWAALLAFLLGACGDDGTSGEPLGPPDSWVYLSSGLAEPRAGAGFAVLGDGRLLVVGGRAGERTLATTELYDPERMIAVAGPPLGAPRNQALVVALSDGGALVTGGVDGNGDTLRSTELYDPATGRFSPAGDARYPRARGKAARLRDGKVLVIGGATVLQIESDPLATIGSALSSTEVFDPETGAWSDGPEMSVPRVTHAVAGLPNGDVLITGGLSFTTASGVVVPTIAERSEIYRSADGAVVDAPEMPGGGRAEHTLTVLRDGRILLTGGGSLQGQAGGEGFDAVALSTAAIFDPAERRWLETESMTIARAGHVGFVLPDGRVVVPGGDSGSLLRLSPTSSCELYEPSRETWSPCAALRTPLIGYAGFVDDLGRPVIVGGSADGATATSDVGIYVPASALPR